MLLTTTVAYAAYKFSIKLTISETADEEYTQLPVIVLVDNDLLQDEKYINTVGTDTDVQIGGHSIPYMLTDNATLVVIPTLLSYSEVTPIYYLGCSVNQTDFDIITGYNGHISCNDTSDIEPGDNFIIEFKGYYVSSSTGAFVNKPGAYVSFSNGSGNITSVILSTESPDSENDSTSNWTDDANAHNGSTGDYAYTTAAIATASWSNSLELINAANVTCATVMVFASSNSTAVNQLSVDVYDYTAADWLNIYEGVFTQSKWESYHIPTGPLTTDRLRIRLYNSSATGQQGRINDTFFGVSEALVSATGVTSAVCIVRTTYNGANLILYIDDMETAEDTTAWSGNVTDNDNDWEFFKYNIMPYVEYLKIRGEN